MPSPILLKTLPPIVQGASYARGLQGVNANGLAPTADNPSGFLSSDTLTATISPGENLPSAFSPLVTWINASLAQVTFQISNAQSAQLALDTPYLVEVFGSRAGTTYPIVAGYLQVLPAAGSQGAASPPDLITLPYCAQLLGQLTLSAAQLEALPTIITAASNAIRKHCSRYFSVQTLTELCPVEQNGTIRLSAFPVQGDARIQGNPEVALTVTNATATSAWVSQAFTGNSYLGNYAITGLTLNWQSGGVTNQQTVLYSTLSPPTIASLATAINAVGNGWVATADTQLGAWPVTEIFDGLTAKGAGPNDFPDGAAQFNVMSSNITDATPDADNGQATGIWVVGRLLSGGPNARWGPDWMEWTDNGTTTSAQVRVTYTAGFNPIPTEIQITCVEFVKVFLERLGTDLIVQSEAAGQYSFTINNNILDFMPRHILQGLSRYRVTWA